MVMSDIAKCPGTECPIKEKCYRFTAESDEIGQSYFVEVPGKMENDKFTCDMYWGAGAQSIWHQLKDITSGKDHNGV